jgi:uncharacterized protein
MFDQALFQRYEELVRKIDLFCTHLQNGFGPRLQCRPGCALCCGRDIEVLPVEFYYLRSCQAVAHAAGQSGSSFREPGGCMFLHQDRCAIYPHRPVICRTHGLPLLVRSADGELRDCCPLNAGPLGLGTLAHADLIDLEKLNTLLSAVNLLFCRQAGLAPDQKLPLSHLFDRD